MNAYPDGLYVTENRSDVEKMKEELIKKEKICKIVYKIGSGITAVASPAFIGSLISPFDFEGPVVEIITGVVLVMGTLMKKFAGDELEEIEALKNEGQYDVKKVSSKIDEKDIENIRITFDKIREKAEQKKEIKAGLCR